MATTRGLVSSAHLRVTPGNPPSRTSPSSPSPPERPLPVVPNATSISASAPTSILTRTSPNTTRAAAKLALEGIEPTPDRCAAFIRSTLLSHSSRTTGRTGRVTLAADEVKHLLAAANFLLQQNEQDTNIKLDKTQAAIDAIATAQQSTASKVDELKVELQKINSAPTSQPHPSIAQESAGAWQTVKSRKRNKQRKTPLAQRLPSTDMLITSVNPKLPMLKGLSPKTVVAKARSAILAQKSRESWEKVNEHPVEHIVRAARPLPSGDWILSVGTIGWSNFLSTGSKYWIPALDPNARLKDANFEVAVHLMPREFDPSNMEHVQEFWDRNPHSFHSTSLRWAGGSNNKKHGTLLLSFRRAADANALLTASVVWDHRMLETRRSVRRPNQCNRCQEFGHVAQSCKNEQRCGKCAASHSTASCICPLEPPAERCQTSHECAHLTFKCANCNGHHTAVNRSCPARDRAYQSAREDELAEGELFQIKDTFEALSSSGLDFDFYIGVQNQQHDQADEDSTSEASVNSATLSNTQARSPPPSPPAAGPSRRRSASLIITHTTQGQATQAMDDHPASRSARHTLRTGVHLMGEHLDDSSSVSSIDTVRPKV